MGFTAILFIIYLILFFIDVLAFSKGIKDKKWHYFIIITSVILVSILILGYLWITSPM